MSSIPTGNPPDTLDTLAGRARGGDATASTEFRRRMGTSLGPIVRLAMRRGYGPVPVVRWVKRTTATLGNGRRAPHEQQTPEIMQLLCAALLRTPTVGADSQCGAADTVVGV